MTEEQDLDLNIKSLPKIKLNKHFKTIVLLLIPLFLAIFFRAYTYNLPVADDLASQTIESSIKNNIRNEIINTYPNLNEQQLSSLIEQNYNKVVAESSAQIEAQKQSISEEIKNYYKNDEGQTYLLEIDTYYYLRQAENLIENGHVGDAFRENGGSYDSYMLAPNGGNVKNNLHPNLIVFSHNIFSLFGNNSILEASFILPLIIGALCTIPAFFIGKRISGNVGGFFAALFLAVNPTFLGRTPAGFSDTDAYNILFPLLIVWFLMESLVVKTTKARIGLVVLAGLMTGIFSFSWNGWWYIFDFIIAAMGIYLAIILIKERKNLKEIFKNPQIKNFLINSVIYILSSALFVTLFSGFSSFYLSVLNPIEFTSIQEAAKENYWPNVYTTVAELNTASIDSIINSVGGSLSFYLSILGIVLIFWYWRRKTVGILYSILLGIWFIGTIYAATQGVRFIMNFAPAFSIALGACMGLVYYEVSKSLSNSFSINKKLIRICFMVLFLILLVQPLTMANNVALNQLPLIDDNWVSALTNIKEKTPENSIITSWWDFGHWFKYWGNRAVTFDGGSQNNPQAHWVGKLFLTSNEKEAVGILRMLNCGGREGYILLNQEIEDPVLAKTVMDEIILLDKNEAQKTLEKYTSNTSKILENTHCNPRPGYVITSEDMVSKSGVWSHFGSWDFKKAKTVRVIKENNQENAIDILVNELGYSESNASVLYNQLRSLEESDLNAWIAPYPTYQGSGNCIEINQTISCSNGINIDLTNKTASISTNSGKVELASYRLDNEVFKKESGNKDLTVAYKSSDKIVIIMSPELLESMFTEMFFYNGENLNNFKLFDHKTGFNDFDVYIWEAIY